MPPVLLYNFERSVYRVPLLDADELYCGHWVKACAPPEWIAPDGNYDAAAFIGALPPPWNAPSLVVVQYDIWGNSIPRGLSGIRCPKVLMLLDTHQRPSPIRRAIAYAGSEPFDAICVQFNRQHMHFLQEAGLAHLHWLPHFDLSPTEFAPRELRPREIVFMGSYDKHPYRRHVLEALTQADLPLEIGTGPPAEVARVHAEAKICLNVSLNGDFNQRVYEVLAAGAFLLTDRLAPEAGMDQFLRDREHLVCFDTAEQAVELARYYLEHREEAERIAAAGHAAYLAHSRPAQKAAHLQAILAGNSPEAFEVRPDRRLSLARQQGRALEARIALYEFLQTVHRLNSSVTALFFSGLEREASDAVDLPRMKISMLRGSGDTRTALHAAGLENRVEWIDAAEIDFAKRQWAVVVCRAEDLDGELFKRWAAEKGGDLAAVARAQSGDAGKISAAMEAYRPRLLNRDPPAFVFNAGLVIG